MSSPWKLHLALAARPWLSVPGAGVALLVEEVGTGSPGPRVPGPSSENVPEGQVTWRLAF